MCHSEIGGEQDSQVGTTAPSANIRCFPLNGQSAIYMQSAHLLADHISQPNNKRHTRPGTEEKRTRQVPDPPHEFQKGRKEAHSSQQPELLYDRTSIPKRSHDIRDTRLAHDSDNKYYV